MGRKVKSGSRTDQELGEPVRGMVFPVWQTFYGSPCLLIMCSYSTCLLIISSYSTLHTALVISLGEGRGSTAPRVDATSALGQGTSPYLPCSHRHKIFSWDSNHTEANTPDSRIKTQSFISFTANQLSLNSFHVNIYFTRTRFTYLQCPSF